jgi:hypothetical protein
MRGELAVDQSKRNAENAVRSLRLVDECYEIVCAIECIELGEYEDALDFLEGTECIPSMYCPHPVIVAKAEIRNAIRYR